MKKTLHLYGKGWFILGLWLLSAITVFGQQLQEAEYFIDEDPGPGNAIPLSMVPGANASLNVTIPTGTLTPGLHVFSVRFKQEDGQWGITGNATFAVNTPVYPFSVQELSLPVVRGEYFWDTDPGAGNGQVVFFPYGEQIQTFFSINTSGLSTGAHKLGVRVMDLGYRWSAAKFYALTVTSANALSPIASFNVSPNPVELVPVLFNNTSQNTGAGTLYQWDMNGDGAPDYSTFDAQHTFAAPGLYTVRLTAINEPSPLAQSANARFYFTNGNLQDAGGTFDDLVPDGSPVLGEGRQGDMQGAYSYGPSKFSGTNGSLNVSALSLSYWFKGTSAEAGIRILDSGGTQRLRTTNGTNHTVGGNNVTANTAVLTNGAWNHVVITWVPGTTGGLKSYLNGTQIGSVNTSGLAPFVIKDIIIGGLDNVTFATGSFDDILLYDHVLTPQEVEALYQETYVSSYVEQVEINMPSNQLIASGSLTFCSGTSLELTAPAGSSYLWNNGESTQSIQVTSSGTWQCAYLDINGTPRLSSQINTTVYQSPVVDVTVYPATSPSLTGSAGISVTPGSGFLFQYTWSSGHTGIVADNLTPGNYFVLVDDGTCQVLTPFTVGVSNETGPIMEAEYFFNSPDPGPGNATSIMIESGDDVGVFSQISVNGLPMGSNTISVRVRRQDGKWGITRTSAFSINDPNETPYNEPAGPILNAEYFLDNNDPGPGNATPISIGIPAVNISASHSFSLNGLAPGVHTVSVRAQNEAGHWGITRTLSFIIEPQLPANLPDYLIPIVSAEYFFDNNDLGPGNCTPLAIEPGTSVSETAVLDLSGLPAGTHKVSIRTKDLLGHWSHSRTSNFEVLNLPCTVPEVEFTFNDANAGQTVNFTNLTSNAQPGVVYSWDVLADGSTESNGTNFSFIFNTPGSYDVLLTADNGGGCISWKLLTVEIGPILPNAITADGPLTFCQFESVNLTAPNGTGHIWNTGQFGQTILANTSGSYHCFYIDNNGNPSWTPALEVTVHPAINYDISVNSATNGNANGSAGVFASPGSGWIYTYLWSNGVTDPIIAGVPGGNYSVVVSDGVCPVTLQVLVPNVNLLVTDEITEGEYFWGADPGPGNGISFTTQAQNPSVNFLNLNTSGLNPGYNLLSVRMRDQQNRWGITRSMSVILSDPDEQPIASVQEPIVNAEYFFDNNDPGPGNAIPLSIGLPNIAPVVSSNISVTGLATGYHLLSLRMRDADGHWGITRTTPFFIEPIIEPVDNTIWPIVAAEYFFGNNDPGPGNGISLAIPGDFSVSLPASVDVSGLPVGSHRISVRTLDLSGHWSITRTSVFDIFQPACPMPVVDFTVGTGNAGSPVSFTNTSANTLGGATYSWDIMANGTVEYSTENASHTFATPGTYYVSLTVNNGGQCVSSLIQEVQIGPLYSNLLNASGPLAFCESNDVTLTAPAGSAYLWNNGYTGQVLTVTESGVYQCFYTNPSGVQSTSNTVSVTVWPLPDVNATVSDATNGQSNGSIGLLVSGGSSNLYTYTWNTGAASPVIVSLAAGNYSVAVSDGQCPVNLNFTVDDMLVPAPQGIVAAEYFWDNTDPGPGFGLSIPIQEGNEVLSFANLPTVGLSEGYHLLSVRTKNSEGRWGVTRTIPVQLFAPLTPEPSQLYDLVNAEYFFDNTDPGPGNATPLIVSNPGTAISESYSLDCSALGPGEHIVSVRVREETGKWSITRTGEFNLCFPPAAPTFLSTTNLVCAGSNLTLSVNNLGFNYIWTLPDGSTVSGAILNVMGILPSMTGLYSVVAEGDPGCYSTPITVFVTVETIPANPSPISGPATVCVTDETGVFFINPIGNATSYDWQFEINGNPQGFIILAGNNTNNIQVDFDGATESPVFVSVEVSNVCGSSFSSVLLVELTCLPNPCPGDFNGDGIVSFADLTILFSQFGCVSGCTADLNGTGTVNFTDLSFFLTIYGTTCP